MYVLLKLPLTVASLVYNGLPSIINDNDNSRNIYTCIIYLIILLNNYY